MKKRLTLALALLLVLVIGCSPRPTAEYAQLPLLTEAPAAPVDAEPPAPVQNGGLVLLTDAPATAKESAAPGAEATPTQDGSQGIQETPPSSSKTSEPRDTASPTPKETESPVTYGQSYDTKEEVALYLHLFGELPPNFITKEAAKKLGWTGGEVEDFVPGKAIGGDYFGNYEGLLPRKKGRKYYECDIGTLGRRSRGAQRIIYSNDGLIYYTDDHYESFTLLYGEE